MAVGRAAGQAAASSGRGRGPVPEHTDPHPQICGRRQPRGLLVVDLAVGALSLQVRCGGTVPLQASLRVPSDRCPHSSGWWKLTSFLRFAVRRVRMPGRRPWKVGVLWVGGRARDSGAAGTTAVFRDNGAFDIVVAFAPCGGGGEVMPRGNPRP